MKPTWIPMLLALTASSQAQDGGDRPDRRPPPVPPLIATLDSDKDRELSAEEITAAAESLGKLDKNGDGEITPEELRPRRPDGAPDGGPKGPPPGQPAGGPRDGKRPVPPVMAALDGDKDGTISAAEIAGAADALRDLDKNGDGKLDPQELMPPPPEGAGGQRGGDRRPQGPPPGAGPQGPQGNRPPGPPPGGPRR